MTFQIDRPMNLFHSPSTLVKDELAVPHDAFHPSHMAYYSRHNHHPYPSSTPITHLIPDAAPTSILPRVSNSNSSSSLHPAVLTTVTSATSPSSMPNHHGMNATLPFPPPAQHTQDPTVTTTTTTTVMDIQGATACPRPSERIRSIPWPSITTDYVPLQHSSYWLYDDHHHPRQQHQDMMAAAAVTALPAAGVPAYPFHQPLPKGPSEEQQPTRRSGDATPRRYKCAVCVKRFSRPSSLATHMHSHTGEKPYTCQVEGCGRRFSVVSNLRRHAKIHINKPSSP